MASENLVEKNNYKERFDPKDYLTLYCKPPGVSDCEKSDFILKSLHDAFELRSPQLSQQHDISILDYGCGPVICNIISAAGLPQVSEIVLAEYTPRSREMVQQWLDKDPSAFDWSPYFSHVVKTLEGKTDQEVIEREERVRNLVKLTSCDITADPPIKSGYEGPYDAVISLLCFDVSCSSIQEFYERIAKASSLVKLGGTLMLLQVEKPSAGGQGMYSIGSVSFDYIKLSFDVIAGALRNACFDISSLVREVCDGVPFLFICAEKKTPTCSYQAPQT